MGNKNANFFAIASSYLYFLLLYLSFISIYDFMESLVVASTTEFSILFNSFLSCIYISLLVKVRRNIKMVHLSINNHSFFLFFKDFIIINFFLSFLYLFNLIFLLPHSLFLILQRL